MEDPITQEIPQPKHLPFKNIFRKQSPPAKKIKKPTLTLTPVPGMEGLKVGTKSDGTRYSVRDDRQRYFFPQEWIKFLEQIPDNKKTLFNTLLNTGGRIDEIMNVRVDDFNFENKSLTLRVTKKKAKLKEKIGKKRQFEVSSKFLKEIKNYIKENNLGEKDYLFLNTSEYEPLDEKQKKYYAKKKIVAVSQMLKRSLQRAGIKDWYNFSLHNIRKTHGMYLKSVKLYARGLDMEEICLRLGHDVGTYLRHYGSPSIFTDKEIKMVINLLGDIYSLE